MSLVLDGDSIILTTEFGFLSNTFLKGVPLFENMMFKYSKPFNFFIKSTILGLSIFGIDTGTGVRSLQQYYQFDTTSGCFC